MNFQTLVDYTCCKAGNKIVVPSTDLALVHILDINSWESRKQVIAVMMDLSKAFNTLDHSVLLDKLNVYGVTGSSGS